MTAKKINRQNSEIKEFLLRNIDEHSKDITALAIKKFGLSRTSILNYLHRIIEEGLVSVSGTTNNRIYKLNTISEGTFKVAVFRDIDEDSIWRFRVFPFLKDIPKNIIDICQYGFTEMFNNIADHSQSNDALIVYKQTYSEISITLIDYGVGIFNKIQKDFDLEDPRSALLELSKGKLTSDKSRHAGEGIYFTSRMFDKFSLMSGNLFYARERADNGWLIETKDEKDNYKGTYVRLRIATNATWTSRDVFSKYQDDDLRFRKTHVPVILGKYPGEQLVSRSQAKRILARFDNFVGICLDFSGVESIGQPFADEIFRIFKNAHPEIPITAVNTTPEIESMIKYVQTNTPN